MFLLVAFPPALYVVIITQTIYLCEYIGHPGLHPWHLLIRTIINVVHTEQRDLELFQ